MSKIKKLSEDRYYYVLDNLNLIHYILKKKFTMYAPNSDIYQELYQEGCLWLVLSAINFKEELGYAFATYAAPNIEGGIRTYLREKTRLIRMPRNLLDLNSTVNNALALGATAEEIANEHNISSTAIYSIIALNNISSLESSINANNDGEILSLIDVIKDMKTNIDDFIEEDFMLLVIEKTLAKIDNSDHRDIYEEYVYSLYYDEKPSQQYLSMKYDKSQSIISRILTKYNKLFKSIYTQELKNTLM